MLDGSVVTIGPLIQEIAAHHGFIVKQHAIACAKSGSRSRKVSEHQEGLPSHLGCFQRDDIDELSICREKGIEL